MKLGKVLALFVALTVTVSMMSFTAHATNVASIGTTEYASFYEAYTAAVQKSETEEVTITLLANATVSKGMTVSKNAFNKITIDGGENKYGISVSTDYNGGTYKNLFTLDTNANGTFEFKNVTFEGIDHTTVQDLGCLFLGQAKGPSANKTSQHVIFDGCVFTDNKFKYLATSEGNSPNASISFNNCLFSNNASTDPNYNSLFYTSSAMQNAISFTGCTFDNNDGFYLIYVKTSKAYDADVTITGNTFKNNDTLSYLLNIGGTATINDNTYIDNTYCSEVDDAGIPTEWADGVSLRTMTGADVESNDTIDKLKLAQEASYTNNGTINSDVKVIETAEFINNGTVNGNIIEEIGSSVSGDGVVNGLTATETVDGIYNVGNATAKVSATDTITVEIPAILDMALGESDSQVGYAVSLEYKGRKDEETQSEVGDPLNKTTLSANLDILRTVSGSSSPVTLSGNVVVNIKLPADAANKDVEIFHEGVSMGVFTADANAVVSVEVPSFSEYIFIWESDTDALVPVTASTDAKVSFILAEQTETGEKYQIVLASTDADANPLYNITSAEASFDFDGAHDGVTFEISGANDFNVTTSTAGKYLFKLPDGVDAKIASKSGESVQIGWINVTGFTHSATETAKTVTIVATDAKAEFKSSLDSIALAVTVAGNDALSYSKQVATKALDVLVEFPNAIENNGVAYQDMTVTLVGGGQKFTYKLGSGTATPEETENYIAYSDSMLDATGKAYYAFTENRLTYNTTYTITFEGAGYRTFKQTILMDKNKKIAVWNNAKDADNPIVTEDGVSTADGKITFLAGDIVRDGVINIYDLSAVVAYFGEINVTDAASAYAKYDLNRDGVIDSFDVALVLVSWGE